MTLIKNSIKLLVGAFAVVCVATTQQTSAIEFTNFISSVDSQGGNANTSMQNMKYNIDNISSGRGAFSTATNTSLSYIKTTYLNTNSTARYSYGSNWSKVFNYVNCYIDNSVNILCKLYDYSSVFNVLSFPVAGYSHTMNNGETITFDNIWLLDGSIVLYTDDLKHTIQYFNNYYLEDYVIFTDPLVESESSSSIDNFFLISFPKKKAWSLKLASQHISPIFKGELDNYNIKEFPFTNSYSLSETTNTTAFPKYSVFMNTNNAKYFNNDIGFNYIKDTNFIAPDFNEPSVSIDSPTYNTDLINYYNSCVNKGENLRKGLQLLTMCKVQDPEFDADNIIIDTGLNYTGSASYCMQLDFFILNAYSVYSGNWNNGIINENENLQNVNAPFNDLIFSWYYNSVFIDSNNYISGLPNGNSWCSVYSNEVFIEDNKTFVEKVSDELNNMFGTGIAKDYVDSVNNHSSFSGLITAIKDGSSEYFTEYLFDPFEEMFNSGYNSFHNQFGVSSCSEIQSVFGEFQLGNIALYIVGALFIFILIMCF